MSALTTVPLAQRATPFKVQRSFRSIKAKSVRPVLCLASVSRRDFIQQAALLATGAALQLSLPSASFAAEAQGYTATTSPLCDESCLAGISKNTPVTTSTGLTYVDITEGEGATPPVGYQVVVNYVAMTQDGKVFANSLEQQKPYDIRVGAGAVIAGLDEGLLTMKSGGIRRLYIPGSLAFPKGLSSAPGRPRVPPNTPVVFDVQLLYVPGLDD